MRLTVSCPTRLVRKPFAAQEAKLGKPIVLPDTLAEATVHMSPALGCQLSTSEVSRYINREILGEWRTCSEELVPGNCIWMAPVQVWRRLHSPACKGQLDREG